VSLLLTYSVQTLHQCSECMANLLIQPGLHVRREGKYVKLLHLEYPHSKKRCPREGKYYWLPVTVTLLEECK